MLVVDELVHGQQLERRHAERLEMADERGVGDAEVRAPALRRDVGMTLRGALHMRLVDHQVAPWRAQQAVALPAEHLVDDHGLRDERRAVVVVPDVGPFSEGISEHGLVPVDVALDRAGVGIEEQLVRVGAGGLLRGRTDR